MDRSNLGVKYRSGLSAAIKSKRTGFGIGIRSLQDDESITHSDLRLAYRMWAAVHSSKAFHIHRISKRISNALKISLRLVMPEKRMTPAHQVCISSLTPFQGEIIILNQICGTECPVLLIPLQSTKAKRKEFGFCFNR